jgi:arylsulfatase A-like enzyme
MHGHSLVPLASGQKMAWRSGWLFENYEYPGAEYVRPHHGVRSDRYKLIHYHEEPQVYELYDLQLDPAELRNLCSDPKYAAVQESLLSRLASSLSETRDMVKLT